MVATEPPDNPIVRLNCVRFIRESNPERVRFAGYAGRVPLGFFHWSLEAPARPLSVANSHSRASACGPRGGGRRALFVVA